jgi:subtilisin family serine protease
VPVAILDTGIDADHDAFRGIKIVAEDFTGEGAADRNGHGTHCAGVVVGRDVSGIRIGVARGVSTLLVGKVLDKDGHGSSAMIFDAILWALSSGARVVSMSLGLDFPGLVSELVEDGWPVDVATSSALEQYRANLRMIDSILDVAVARRPFDGGAAIVAAVGNESRRNLGSDYSIAASLPAAGRGVVSVGAVGTRGTGSHVVAHFSNSQPTLVAPGIDIVSARSGGGLAIMSGTSMACPHVAGVAALWWEAAREREDQLDAGTIERLMLAAASASSLSDSRELRGAGLVRVPT